MEKINDSNLKDFPELMENELRDLTMGIYKLRQAASYTDEHSDDNGLYEIMTHKEHNINEAQIGSGHTSSKTYTLWIEYNQGLNPITGWYCGCRSGTWTVGCCAHLASVLWYLGCSRHLTDHNFRTNREHMQFVQDASLDTWSASSDSEDE